jgi:hypothetical protein
MLYACSASPRSTAGALRGSCSFTRTAVDGKVQELRIACKGINAVDSFTDQRVQSLLTRCPLLETLSIDESVPVCSLAAAGVSCLTRLSCLTRACRKLADLELGLGQLKQLRTLELLDCPCNTDLLLPALASIEGLEKLDLSRSLGRADNNFQPIKVDLGQLSPLGKLRVLKVSSCTVMEPCGMAALTQLHNVLHSSS